jgi:hypothetical protein
MNALVSDANGFGKNLMELSESVNNSSIPKEPSPRVVRGLKT